MLLAGMLAAGFTRDAGLTLGTTGWRRERITPEELFAEMHRQGRARLEEVQWAILESGGHITFVPSRDH